MKRTNLFFLLIILIGFLGVFVFYQIFLPLDKENFKEMLFKIEKGEGAKEISSNLQEQNLIGWGSVFRFYVLLSGNSKKLQAGTYRLSSSMNIPKIIGKFISGDIAKETVTIPEGWNLRDIGSLFERMGMFRAEDLWKITGFPAVDYGSASSPQVPNLPKPKDFSLEFACLAGSDLSDSCGDFLKDKPKNISLEGYLFPDTYQIIYGTAIEDAMRLMLSNFDGKLNQDMRKEIKRQKKTIFEIITMASMIEKEVKTREDKELVSGILWKRLLNKMPLQVDATINYILGQKDTNISIEQTQIDSPYNTYKYRGLPLGPISNPGIESITVAIYPKSSPFWYYLSTPNGETIFSKTLEGHNIAKAKYLK